MPLTCDVTSLQILWPAVNIIPSYTLSNSNGQIAVPVEK